MLVSGRVQGLHSQKRAAKEFASENGWLEYEFRFLFGHLKRPIFRGKLAVSFGEDLQALASSWKPLISVDPLFQKLGLKTTQQLTPFFFGEGNTVGGVLLEFRSASNNYVFCQTNIRMTSNTRRFS